MIKATPINRSATYRPKRCKSRECGQQFTPRRAIQPYCGYACEVRAATLAVEKRAAKAKAEDKRKTGAQLEAIKPRSQWIKEAQTAFNAWVRQRDAGQPCISCGRQHGGKLNAGHYRSTGAAPELRFEPLNCHLQCETCNTHLHGNLISYRVNLLAKIGPDWLEWVEGPHPPQKWSIEQLRFMRDEYRARVRAMKKEQA